MRETLWLSLTARPCKCGALSFLSAGLTQSYPAVDQARQSGTELDNLGNDCCLPRNGADCTVATSVAGARSLLLMMGLERVL